jgi:outer membrane protein
MALVPGHLTQDGRQHRHRAVFGGGLRLLGATLVASGLALASGLVLVSPASAMSLQEALMLTNQNSPTLRAARAGVRAANESVRQTIAKSLPQIKGAASSSLTYSESLAKSDVFSQNHSLGLTVDQVLYAGGAVDSGLKLADANVRAQWQRLAATEQQLMTQTAARYMDIVLSQAVVSLNQAALDLSAEQLRAANARRNAGVATITDVTQAEAAVAKGQADLTFARQNVQIAKSALFELTGEVPSHVYNPGLPGNLPYSLDDALNRGLAQSPAIKAARLALQAADNNIRLQEAALYPTLAARGTATRSWAGTEGSAVTAGNAFTIGATLSVPIFAGGETLSKVRQAKHQRSQALAEVQVQEQSLRSTIMQAWNAYNSQRAVIQAFEAQVVAAEASYNAVSEQARQGQASTLDVLQTEKALSDARISLARSQAEYIKASYSLLGAMGELSADRVGGGVVFSPAANYAQVRSNQIPEFSRENFPSVGQFPAEIAEFLQSNASGQ